MTRAISLAVVLLAAAAAVPPAPAQTNQCGELVLHNAKIATMDARDTTATAIVIRGDRIVAVSIARGIPPHSACATVIDAGGRRVIPGMIDTHDHPSYFTARPGHYTVLDTAASIADIQARIRERAAKVPAGEWITSLGGWSLVHIGEKRMPTSAELDAATSNHPVLLVLAAGGAANTAGKTWLAGKGVTFNPDGTLSAQASIAALNALRATMTFEDRKRALSGLLAYYSSMGVTTHIDQGGPRAPAPALASITRAGDGGLNTLDPSRGYEPHAALEREGKLPGRVRLMFYSLDITPELPVLRQRLDNQMMAMGSDWLRVNGIGERVVGGDNAEWQANGQPTPQYEAALNLVAERGWSLEQHSTVDDQTRHVDVWEKVNAKTPLAPLRWTLAHNRGIDVPTLNRLKAMGVGVSMSGSRYLSDGKQPGPPIKTIVESGIHASYGSDNPTNPPTNPWLHMYAIVTGKNFEGKPIEADQVLSRQEALRLYTISGAWFSRDEDRLGSIEAGKLADIVVLSDDFLDSARVPDDAIKRLTSVLTIVGGRIVHNALGR